MSTESPFQSPEQEQAYNDACERIESRKAEAAAEQQTRRDESRAAAAQREAEVEAERATDPYVVAVKALQEQSSGINNIHDAALNPDAPRLDLAAAEAQIEAGEVEAAARDYDPAALADELALEPAGVETMAFENAEAVRECVTTINEQLAAEIDDQDVSDFVQSLASSEEAAPLLEQLRTRTIETIDSWASDKFGTSEARTPEQTEACASVWNLAVRTTLGSMAKGLRAAPIDAALARARVSLDESYRPGHKEPKPAVSVNKPRPTTTNADTARSIHELQWR